MAYATPADLASLMQVPSVDTATAQLILDMVADSMDDWCGQSLAQQDIAGLLIDGTGAAEFVLPGFPVNSVASIEILGADGTWTLLADGVDYTWSSSGVVERRWPHGQPGSLVVPPWPAGRSSIRVAYNRGVGTVKASVKGVNLSVAARLMTNPDGLLSEQIGAMQLRYAAKAAGIEFSPVEQGVLDRATDPVLA